MNEPRRSIKYDGLAYHGLQALIGKSPRAFSLNVAVYSDTGARGYLVHMLQQDFHQIEVVTFWPYSDDLFEHVHAAAEHGPHDALFVSGLEDALESKSDCDALIRGLNTSPPRWKAWFPFPVIFWVNQRTADRLAHEARDFWEWQTGVFRLDLPGEMH